ncbi:MAG: nuclease PIN [Actinomycetota bacterium]|nr:nuclease PIN [Actinomycetota bacterium]
MKLRLFPQERAGLRILSAMAQEIVLGVHTLSELLGASASEFEPLAEQMRLHEAASSNLLVSLLTHMRTSFINPLPREDLFALARFLNEAIEKLAGAAELITLNKMERIPARASDQLEVIARQAELTVEAMGRMDNLEELEDYWIQVLRLAKRAEHTHRVFVSELLRDHKPMAYVRYRDVADQLVNVTKDMRQIATQVGSIIVKES